MLLPSVKGKASYLTTIFPVEITIGLVGVFGGIECAASTIWGLVANSAPTGLDMSITPAAAKAGVVPVRPNSSAHELRHA